MEVFRQRLNILKIKTLSTAYRISTRPFLEDMGGGMSILILVYSAVIIQLYC